MLEETGIDIVDARDVAAAMVRVADKALPGARYVLSATYVTLPELLHLLEEATGLPAPTRRFPRWLLLAVAWMAERYATATGRPLALAVNAIHSITERKRTSADKVIREFGVTFRPLADTVRDTVAWYRPHHPEWCGA